MRAPSLINSPATLMAIIVMFLISLGITTVYSASGARAGLEARRIAAEKATMPEESFEFHHAASYATRQVAWAGAGVLAIVILMNIPIDKIERASPYLMFGSLCLLLLVLVTPLGVESKGARRWMHVGPVVLQPSEFAKISLVLFMAKLLAQKREEIRDWRRGFVPVVGVAGCFAALVVLEKDLGTIILMGSVMLGMWCLARMRFTHLGGAMLASLPVVGYLLFQHAYRINRILAVLDPDKYALTHGYQLNQSLIAVGSGGLFGHGLGLGLQKYHFLSEAHTDFIFAIACEELGLIGASGIVLLFLAFVMIGFRISYKATDYFAGIAASGLTMTIGCAAFINFFVVLGMAPTKGLALPFFTYGGSSLVASMIAVGVLLNIANYTARGGTNARTWRAASA